MVRNKFADIVKGIGIILMVYGHVNTYGSRFIYLFHMPLFFLISGYLIAEKDGENCAYLSNMDFQALLGGVKKRIRSLYIPFLKYNILFIILHNFLFYAHVYDMNFGYNDVYVSPYSLHDIIINVIKTFLFLQKAELMIIGYWFLQVMFFSMVLFLIFKYVIRNVWSLYITFFCFYIALVLIHSYISFPWIVVKFFTAAIYITTGYILKQKKRLLLSFFDNRILAFLAFVSFLLVGMYSVYGKYMTMDSLKFTEFPIYYCVSLLGCYGVFYIARMFADNNKIGSVLCYIGQRTLLVLTWHFSGFKVLSFIIILFYGLSICHLAEFPIIKDVSYLTCILYSIFGILVPLGIGFIVSLYKNRIFKVAHE